MVNKGGRPSALTPEVVGKLEQALQNGFTIGKACELSGIHRDTYYSHLSIDTKFSDKMTNAQNFALEVARQNVVNAIIKDKDIATSRWYLERKARDEFSTKTTLGGGIEVRDRMSEEDALRIEKELQDIRGQADDNSAGNNQEPYTGE